MNDGGRVGKRKGSPKTGGRRKGTPNLINAELKDLIRGALEDAGGRKYLTEQAAENPSAFLSLIAKILPKDITVAGNPDNPINMHHALNSRAIQAVDDLIRAIAGARASKADSQVDTDRPLLPAALCDGEGRR